MALRLKGGDELPFLVDTGSPVTLLDKSLQPRLGKRLKEKPIYYTWGEGTMAAYKAPKLYLGNTPLQTPDLVWTDDLRQCSRPTPKCPVMGVLGMDNMRRYAIQLDFVAKKMRLLDSDHLEREDLGTPFPLKTTDSGHLMVPASFTGSKELCSIVDTGCMFDGVLEPKEFKLALRRQGVLPTEYPAGFVRRGARFQTLVFGGDTYTNVVIGEAPEMNDKRPHYLSNVVGLPFLIRHLVTFDFPKNLMYLKRRTDAS